MLLLSVLTKLQRLLFLLPSYACCLCYCSIACFWWKPFFFLFWNYHYFTFVRIFLVASDNSLHEFLDSFLKYRSRWYDFPHRGAKGIVAGIIVGEHDLSRRVFIVLYRM